MARIARCEISAHAPLDLIFSMSSSVSVEVRWRSGDIWSIAGRSRLTASTYLPPVVQLNVWLGHISLFLGQFASKENLCQFIASKETGHVIGIFARHQHGASCVSVHVGQSLSDFTRRELQSREVPEHSRNCGLVRLSQRIRFSKIFLKSVCNQ